MLLYQMPEGGYFGKDRLWRGISGWKDQTAEVRVLCPCHEIAEWKEHVLRSVVKQPFPWKLIAYQ